MDSRSEAVRAFSENALYQLRLFRRQYLQLVDLHNLTWPAAEYLRNANVQEWIFENCFEDDGFLPPERYRLGTLKPLLRKVEESIVDPEEDVSDHCPSVSCHVRRNEVHVLLFPPILIVTLLYIGNIRQSHVHSSQSHVCPSSR